MTLSLRIAPCGSVLVLLGTIRLQAGDANMDLNFDQLDLVQVQVAGKYLTGLAATWGEGDWDGAPGGQPGDPPPGDGLFNQVDVIAALTANTYLTGPYAATRSFQGETGGQAGLSFVDTVPPDRTIDSHAELAVVSPRQGGSLLGDGGLVNVPVPEPSAMVLTLLGVLLGARSVVRIPPVLCLRHFSAGLVYSRSRRAK